MRSTGFWREPHDNQVGRPVNRSRRERTDGLDRGDEGGEGRKKKNGDDDDGGEVDDNGVCRGIMGVFWLLPWDC